VFDSDSPGIRHEPGSGRDKARNIRFAGWDLEVHILINFTNDKKTTIIYAKTFL
jgi:hypothetical protein